MSPLVPEELELKLELRPEQIKELASHPFLTKWVVGTPTHQTLQTVYYDTADQALRRAGYSLRLRRKGDSWVQTIKSMSSVRNGLSNPVELESAVNSQAPNLEAITDFSLRRNLIKIVNRCRLKPVFETKIDRALHVIMYAGGDLELALDAGVVKAKRREAPICEAELELKAGPTRSLLRAAIELFGSSAISFSRQSKAERGFRLLGDRSAEQASDERLHFKSLKPSMSCREAVCGLLGQIEHQIVESRSLVLQSTDSKGPHQLRIGLRRLRALLRSIRHPLGKDAVGDFEQSARLLARAIAPLRDADVIIEDIYLQAAKSAPDLPGLSELSDFLLAHRESCRSDAKTALTGPQWSHFQLFIALWLAAVDLRELDRRVKPFAARAIKQSWKRCAAIGRDVVSMSDEQRHELRLALKAHRYTAELFGSLFEVERVGQHVKNLKKLQDAIGHLTDGEIAARLMAMKNSQNLPQSCCLAAGYIAGWHARQSDDVLSQVQRHWKSLRRARLFWT
ncbi:MAG: CYTH and CHAD domain-containing protein [Hyphomicrobiaceae bacterium]